MKKQDGSSLRSSSYRQENSPKNLQAKSIGCMSGIFHLIYRHNNRRGKFITSGKKQEKNTVSPSSKQRQESDNDDHEFVNNNNNNNNDGNNFITRLTSCDVQRSPTLPAEIRLRGNNVKTVEICLEEAAEKRRKLIEELEKCDEDLKELKKIIDVVRSNSVTVTVDREDNDNNNNKINGDLQPSPVSVLDDFTPLSSTLSSSSYPRRYANGRAAAIHQQKQKQKRKPGEEDTAVSNICLVEKMRSETAVKSCSENVAGVQVISPVWGSKAMIDSLNEVCRDIAWGERREVGRIGLALQDYICSDLIEEFVKDLLGSFCMFKYSFPFEACRRSLRF
ncbi:hypothetical protein KPL70_018672 [Citrus sinensis]|uniref:uncharacterized protein LOC102609986 n=1 Tax=Citrus sinensis TaxID=2711 RepID=UPI0003D71BB4|nr:uncharacterized protein LOC102609986 [Citrus sinensis]KAH9675059.1 hypothetical protein KPL70_018672 [Citrus sinensis]